MAIYTATFSGVAVSAAQDVFEITAATRTAVLGIILGQYTDFGDAASEILSVTILRGYTVSGSGGSSVTPAKTATATTRAAVASVEANNTTVANTGTPVTLFADVMNIAAGYIFPDLVGSNGSVAPICVLESGERLVVRLSAPADSITMNGTLIFEEPGR